MRRAAVLFSISLGILCGAALAEEPAPVLEPWRDAPAAALDQPGATIAEPPTPAPAIPAATEAPGEELNLGWTLVRTVIVLAIVVLSIYITLNFGLRRMLGIAATPRGEGVVQVVERVPLDQKRAVFVIKAAGEYLLIGGGDGSLQLIAKLDPSEVERVSQPRPPSLALSPLLQRLLKRRDVPVAPAPAPPAPGDNS